MKILLLFTAFLACASAAEKIRYDQIPGKLHMKDNELERRSFRIVSRTGTVYTGNSLHYSGEELILSDWDGSRDRFAPGEITRIEVRQRGRFAINPLDAIAAAFVIPILACLPGDGTPPPHCGWWFAATPLFLAYGIGAIPVYAGADLVTLFLPPKVFEIEQP